MVFQGMGCPVEAAIAVSAAVETAWFFWVSVR